MYRQFSSRIWNASRASQLSFQKMTHYGRCLVPMTSVFQLGLVSLILPVSWSAPEKSAKSTFLTVIILKHPVQSKYMAERISPTPHPQVRALNGISRWVFKARKAYNIRNFMEEENVMGISAASSVQEYI
ncbi:uncharacterized protein ASPGLDRAFT_24144 [Aspergillus glaucus CBS 516.65]|uniref:Uncharacterized protein n=1 Tax=Aspergillus glaucus CBS 516.65 TaxID=1160497 RepID=A0A1L9VPZ2_ASPGL|nr:hypothetical protein ASPGLDRAFT_24144 [Aspergillus glaucus CBS 516.65]OJJ85979.1 hypothetical protein ASPGLDRAFT_24144 [Aspergillus glaucus CBS 516.65]